MLDKATVELTDKEAKTIVQFLKTTPMQGNLETLPTALSQIAIIIQKIDAAFNPPAIEVRPQETPKPKRRRH